MDLFDVSMIDSFFDGNMIVHCKTEDDTLDFLNHCSFNATADKDNVINQKRDAHRTYGESLCFRFNTRISLIIRGGLELYTKDRAYDNYQFFEYCNSSSKTNISINKDELLSII